MSGRVEADTGNVACAPPAAGTTITIVDEWTSTIDRRFGADTLSVRATAQFDIPGRYSVEMDVRSWLEGWTPDSA